MSETSLRILGCGSSAGVPRLGGPDMAGDWGKCDPSNPKNYRTRCSVLVERRTKAGVTRVLVDTSPDLRAQLLAARVAELDAVLITHDHADQIHGFDDLRQITYLMKRRVDVWADAKTAKTLMSRFGYCFVQPAGSGYPAICNLHILPEPFEPFAIAGAGGPLPVHPFMQQHGSVHSVGFRFGTVAYSPDVNKLDENAFAVLDGTEVWVVDALHWTKPHPSHAHVELALEWIARLKPRHAVLTNLGQRLDYAELKASLPAGVEPAYDGLTVRAED
jgi:Metal-dependent hydrolases of the beta-lactamase superfamily I